MQEENIKYLARTNTVEGFISLLKAYGSDPLVNNNGYKVGNCIDTIIDGAWKDEDEDRKTQKHTLISDFVAKRGVFAAGQEIPADTAQQFRETMEQLTQVVVHLAKKLEGVEGELSELKETVAAQDVDAAPKPKKAAASKTPRLSS